MNTKRKVNARFESLGTYRLTRKDIFAFEDIIHRHMVKMNKIRQDQFIASGSDADKVRKAKYYDIYVEMSPYWLGGRGIELDGGIGINIGPQYVDTFDSIKDVPTDLAIRYLKISGKPGVYLSFSPLKTQLVTRRAEAGILERKSMDEAARRIKARLTNCKSSKFNIIKE